MRGSNAIVASLAVQISLVSAVNTVNFVNHCPYDIWYWVVGPRGSTLSGNDDQRNIIPRNANTAIHNIVNTEALGAGIALKLRDLPHFNVAPAGIIQVEYHLEPSQNAFWYDLSAIDCNHATGPENPLFCPLVGGGIEIYTKGRDGENCPRAWCKNGKCHNTYTEHGSWYSEPSFRCSTGVDLIVEMCTERAGPRTKNNRPGVVLEPYSKPAAGSLIISPDGTCGGSTGYTCVGGHWGECCSQWGFCGSSAEYCDDKCQSWFGVCPGEKYDAPPTSLALDSYDMAALDSSTVSSASYAMSNTIEPTLTPSALPRYGKPLPTELASTPYATTNTTSPTSTALAPILQYGISISPKGLCGSETSFTCAGSLFGSCCSKYNYCGDTAAYCGDGCKPIYGTCHGVYGRGMKSPLVTKTTKFTETRMVTRYVQSQSSMATMIKRTSSAQ